MTDTQTAVEAARALLADIESELLPASQTNWLNSKWKHDLFPRVRSTLALLSPLPQRSSPFLKRTSFYVWLNHWLDSMTTQRSPVVLARHLMRNCG